MNNSSTQTYVIKELEKLSGIKAHTIRIWEKRYNLICPKRTKTNIRIYTGNDLKKILNVSDLIRHGFKISKISQMSDNELVDELVNLENNIVHHEKAHYQINQLLSITLSFDQIGFDTLSSKIIHEHGLKSAFSEVFFPLLNKIGDLWARSEVTVVHEHFLSSNFRKILFAHIRPQTSQYAKKIILFLPQWEEHELTLLLTHTILSNEQFSPIYFGPQVPLSNLITAINHIQPTDLISVLTLSNYQSEIEEYLEKISEFKIKVHLILSEQNSDMRFSSTDKNLCVYKSINELYSYFNFV